MIINVIPAVPLPNVLFAVTLRNLEDDLPAPLSWVDQLQCLERDDLEIPKAIHSLDKAAGIPSLLTEVTFDVQALTISCQFVDGAKEEWPLVEEHCLRLLRSVVDDVNESSLETERMVEWEKEKERQRVETPAPPLASSKVIRHKKQRSLLMTLVASIVPLSSLSSTSSSRLSPPPTPVSVTPPCSPISPRARWRRARSALVDTFRLYVLTELSRRFPSGGYYSWILQSMLRRATHHMEQLVQQADGWSPPEAFHSNLEDAGHFAITAASLPPSDDEEDSSEDTDTDGSSVHTPLSSHFNNRYAQQQSTSLYPKRHNYVSTSPRRYLSEDDHAVYTELAAMTSRLRRLLILDNARQIHLEDENKHHYAMLEIRSRRRAWLNKALVGGVRSEAVDVRMAMPFQSSPLARRSWSGDDYDYVPDEGTYDGFEYEYERRLGSRLQRTRLNTGPRLFPVSEDEIGEELGDDDEALDARELELHFQGFGFDLEGGVGGGTEDEEDGAGVRVAFDIERPTIRPRVRTNSMYRHHTDAHGLAELGSITRSGPQSLTSSSILCQPLPAGKSHETSAPVYAELDISVGGLEVAGRRGFGKYAEEEFTLAMDLPLNAHSQDRDIFASRRRIGVSDLGWITPESTPF